MAKIVIGFILLIYSFSIAENKTSTVDNSAITLTYERKTPYFIDSYQGEIICRLYLPEDMSKKRIVISCELGPETLWTNVQVVPEKKFITSKTNAFFFPGSLYQMTCLFPPTHKYSTEEILSFLEVAKNWRLKILDY